MKLLLRVLAQCISTPEGGIRLLLDALKMPGADSLNDLGKVDSRGGSGIQVHLITAEIQDCAAAVGPVDEGGNVLRADGRVMLPRLTPPFADCVEVKVGDEVAEGL